MSEARGCPADHLNKSIADHLPSRLLYTDVIKLHAKVTFLMHDSLHCGHRACCSILRMTILVTAYNLCHDAYFKPSQKLYIKSTTQAVDLPRVLVRVWAIHGAWTPATYILGTPLRLQIWCCCRAARVLCSSTIIEA